MTKHITAFLKTLRRALPQQSLFVGPDQITTDSVRFRRAATRGIFSHFVPTEKIRKIYYNFRSNTVK